ncbi:unnamed protein product [Gongylonema pulchrum]|uniref:FACT complex subunit n=1 Tax=Gongylonema pulchrum TaxID=637853 RepID=A0A183D9U6_9BILA|nr:unnamed protein product [Gongylonema pulchrum]
MIDLPGRKVDSEFAQSWAAKERGPIFISPFRFTVKFVDCFLLAFDCPFRFSVKLYEVTAKDRNTLVDLVVYLGSRHFHSQRKLPIFYCFVVSAIS